ncbi:hypothetical protein AJ80_04961 [Polytolypa hystricis UAMH7299]|uniref:Phospholipase/carboxylesterase/thioesterase domain-containing protein n=1 Tax=Polytolypa hystricis (strain UAMH7299) TaxID=1447883 RepID=A0A2B7Y834_POLH7|nr:hypothetical protein AJ80_04961 [Polytolypa hystricis UAMH7299]
MAAAPTGPNSQRNSSRQRIHLHLKPRPTDTSTDTSTDNTTGDTTPTPPLPAPDMPLHFPFLAHLPLRNIRRGHTIMLQGLRESVRDVLGVLDAEVERLGGRGAERVVLGGMSQGMSVGLLVVLVCLLPETRGRNRRIAGKAVEMLMLMMMMHSGIIQNASLQELLSKFLHEIILSPSLGSAEQHHHHAHVPTSLANIPILLIHGIDDVFVDISHGRRARDILQHIFSLSSNANALLTGVEWREYIGAENEGYWIKKPEQVGDMLAFLKGVGF